MKRPGVCYLSIAIGADPPKEFRLFKAGANSNRNGPPAIFDDIAARDVMANHAQHGADGMLDLEHLSLDDSSPHYDPDARGWYQLELRPAEKPQPGAANDLYSVAVTYTEDGDARIRGKRQRYISPAFTRDPKTNRVRRLINVALTALPASDDLTPLVAARQSQETTTMPINPRLLALLGLPAGTDAAGVAAAFAAMPPEDQAKIWTAMSAAEDEDDKADAMKAAPPPPPADPKAAPAKDPAPPAPVVAHRQDTAAADLAAEVVKLRHEANARDLRDVLEAAKAANKTTPALERWSLAEHANNPAAARVFWNAVEARGAPAAAKQPPGMPPRKEGENVIKLRQGEEGAIRSIAKRMGSNGDEAVAFRLGQIKEASEQVNDHYQRDLANLREEYQITGDEGGAL